MKVNNVETSCTAEDLATAWDVVVIGAGPAGALTALLSAKAGLRTLLVDKAQFPRTKVCGSCLNHIALASLEEVGLMGTIESIGAVDLHSLQLSINGVRATVALPRSKALSRKTLDATIVHEATRHGAAFLPGVVAHVVSDSSAAVEFFELEKSESEFREVELRGSDSVDRTRTKVVVVADGIAGHSINQVHEFERSASENSRLGAGITIKKDSVPGFYQAGHIYMASSHGGYVGVVQLENGDYDIACAFDRDFLKVHGEPGKTADAILGKAKLPPISFSNSSWRGTPALTQTTTPKAAARIFLIGDAAGYTEPFTGEGIGWALSSALQLAPILRDAAFAKPEKIAGAYAKWEAAHSRLLASRHSTSLKIANLLRWQYLPEMVSLAVSRSKSLETAIVRTALGIQHYSRPTQLK